MKIEFDSNDDLPLNTTIEIQNVTIAVRAIFMKVTNIIHKFSQMNVCINYGRERNKNVISETKSFYILLAFLLITSALLIGLSIYFYIIKYKAKQKHLLPFYVRDNELKEILY